MSDQPDANFLVPLIMFGWPILLAALFLMMPSRRAVIAGFIVAWLFLPIAEYEFKGIPEYNKMTATSLSLFFATLLFDVNRVLQFRPKWLDLPMLVLCLCPMASSLTNGLGVYDGFSESNGQFLRWGLPYFIGRVYFTDFRSMRELAIGIFLGGILYMPFCWFEMRMSPQLHRLIYGYHQHAFSQTLRLGGYRPMVFLQHGLMVGMWMTTTSLVGLALWQTGSLKQIRGVPIWIFVGLMGMTTVMCRSTGAILLLMAGIGIFVSVRYFKTSLALVAIGVICFGYLFIRASGVWDGQEAVDLSQRMFGTDRAESVAVRFDNEEAIAAKARQQVAFGWGGWGRSRIYDERGKDVSITDSQWVITYGTNGAVGLIAIFSVMLLPPLWLVRRAPANWWTHPVVAPSAALAVVLVLWTVDNLMNAMFNPVYIAILGGLAGMKPLTQVQPAPPQAARPAPPKQPFVPRRKRGKPRPGAASRPASG